MITQITTHVQDAIDRLLEQYKGQARIVATFTTLVQQMQDLEDALFPLFDRLDIDASEGVQLDNVGILIGQPRDGMTDADYRQRLKIRIFQNISKATPDTLIQVYSLLLNASFVMLTELYIAEVSLMANAPIPSGQEFIIYQNLQSIAPAGVRIAFIGSFDPSIAFSFEGGSDGAGFGDLNNLSVGGLFAQLYLPIGMAFQFTPGASTNGGFGDTRDSGIGGLFESL